MVFFALVIVMGTIWIKRKKKITEDRQ
jgi:hypothetical protein